ncbi:hypothetical protein TNCV_4961511 [Trichonephila clavipes]|uniref:Uncharacterized protein n=1 Tax=Trichonephila clavipes TaxID=2585209 RepID=A0A8X6SRA0_TRICX|nr:hypothetical protein TNCV_4961511 [Trichonephila clavipes]
MDFSMDLEIIGEGWLHDKPPESSGILQPCFASESALLLLGVPRLEDNSPISTIELINFFVSPPPLLLSHYCVRSRVRIYKEIDLSMRVFDYELSLRSTPSVLFDDLNLKLLSYKLTIGTFHSLL